MKKPARAKKPTSSVSTRPVLLVTGLSGAGHSTALKVLEDIGYRAIDNLPLSLLDPLLAQKEGRDKPVAVGIDSRTWDFDAAVFLAQVKALRRRRDIALHLLFLDCDDDVLQQRFTETRRVHPLAADRPVRHGIALERQLVSPLRRAADEVIDTTALKTRDFRQMLEKYYATAATGLSVFVMSFGFAKGLPREADMVFDVRFLDNPYADPKLRPLSGQDAPVAARIGKDKAYREFFKNLTAFLAPVLPRYAHEGRRYLTIAVGCTGGRHRSVFVAESLQAWLAKRKIAAQLRHRDMDAWAIEHGYPAAAEKTKKGKRK